LEREGSVYRSGSLAVTSGFIANRSGNLSSLLRYQKEEKENTQNCTSNTDTSSVDFFFFARRRSWLDITSGRH